MMRINRIKPHPPPRLLPNWYIFGTVPQRGGFKGDRNGIWQRATWDTPYPAVAPCRTDDAHRSGCWRLRFKACYRRRKWVLPDHGRGDGDCRRPDFHQPRQRDRPLWHRVYRLAVLGRQLCRMGFLAALLAPLYVCRAGLPLCHRMAVYARSKPQRPEQSTGVWRHGRSGGRDAGEPWLDVQAANAGSGE